MARKRKYIDRRALKQLCLAQLSNEEIATCLRVDRNTIERRYGAAIKKWKEDGVGGVRRRLYMKAMSDGKDSMTGIIFFLKNFGGMSDCNKDNGEQQKLTRDGLPVQRDEPITAHKPN